MTELVWDIDCQMMPEGHWIAVGRLRSIRRNGRHDYVDHFACFFVEEGADYQRAHGILNARLEMSTLEGARA